MQCSPGDSTHQFVPSIIQERVRLWSPLSHLKETYLRHAALTFIHSTHSSQALALSYTAPLPGEYIPLHAWG